MADTVKTTKQFKAVASFADGDDRTIAIDNPKNGLTKADFDSLPKDIIIGDKTGAAQTDWKNGKYYNAAVTTWDFGGMSTAKI